MINSMHNDIQCLSLESAIRPCDRCWFTSKQIQEWSSMNKDTLGRRITKLIEVGRVIDNSESIEDMSKSMTLKFERHQTGDEIFTDIMLITLYGANNIPHETKVYNLNVLNHLAMVELDNEKLNSIANKFSDILSEVETTGQYNVQRQAPSYAIEDKIKRAQAWIEEQKHMLQLEEEKEKLELACSTLTQERDQAIKTKAQIGSKREATIMGKLGVQSKKIVKLEDDLTKANDNVNALQNELDRTLSTMFTTKRVCEILRAKFDLKYADSTLNQKVSKALKSLSDELNERVVPQYTVVGDITRTRYFYTDRTVEVLLNMLSNDSDYLKSVK